MVYMSGWVGPSFWLLFSALSLIGFLGNGLVIAAVLGHAKMRRSAMNLLLLNLALADLLNLALTSLEWSPALWTGIPQWPLASLWWSCPVARYLECVFLFASILSQLAVCAERFVAICFPLNARRWCTQSNAIISLLAIWVFVLLFALPNALFNELLTLHPSSSSSSSSFSSNSSSSSSSLSSPPPSISFCLNPWSLTELWLAYKWAEFLLLFLVPALCCAFLHSRLCVALQSAKGGGHHEHLLLDKGTEQMRARRRVVRMLIGCVAVQLLCYSPIQAMFLATAIFNVLLVPPYGLVLLLNALALACSAANPLLYTLFSKNFRARTRSMLLFGRSFHPSAQLGQIIIMGIGNHQQQQQVQQLQPNAMLL